MAKWLKQAGLALSVWMLILLAMPFVGPSGRQIAVVGDEGKAIRTIVAAGGRVLDIRRNAVIGISGSPSFAAQLYRNGAILVLEGRIAAGCFAPTTKRV
jgi:hypothetical protein